MNDPALAGKVSVIAVIVAGILVCFWGYRLLKFTLGLLGFIAGAYAGWEIGLSVLHANNGMALVCALIGGIIGIVLYVWLYFLGVFLLGATAGAIVAAAFFNGAGHPPQPVILLAISVGFGIFALVAQKFMIVISTAFSGAYLITAGIWPLVASGQNPSRIWLDPTRSNPLGNWGYAALTLWVVLGIIGTSIQFRAGPRRVAKEEKK
jgi:hypothetical protein